MDDYEDAVGSLRLNDLVMLGEVLSRFLESDMQHLARRANHAEPEPDMVTRAAAMLEAVNEAMTTFEPTHR